MIIQNIFDHHFILTLNPNFKTAGFFICNAMCYLQEHRLEKSKLLPARKCSLKLQM